MMNGQLALATAALFRSRERERCRTEAVISSPSGDKAEAGIHERCGRVAGPAAFVLTPNHFAADLRGSARIKNQKLISSLDSFARAKFCRGLCVRDLFSRGFHRIGAGFTASAQFILRFAFHSLMLRLRMGQSAIETGNQNYGDY
jgi:hypothetical protein